MPTALNDNNSYTVKVCAVGDQGHRLVAQTMHSNDVINISDELQHIDVLLIISEMEDPLCRKQTTLLAQKARQSGILTLALCSRSSAAIERLQQEVHAVILLATDGWPGMHSIGMRYAFFVQRMKAASLGTFNCDIEDLREFFGIHQSCIVNYRMAVNEIQLDEGKGLLPSYTPEQWRQITHLLLLLGSNSTSPINHMTMAASQYEMALDGNDTEMWFALSKNASDGPYFDALFFTR